ncbi:30336_t:CDS:2, partial [Racocetra persica]
MTNLQEISNYELISELKRRLDLNINIEKNTPTRLYENQPKNLLSFEQKEVMGSQVLFTFIQVFKEYTEGLNFNQRETERIQLTFD